MFSAIVITTIYEPTVAVREFAGLKKFKLIVVGDNKTPANWNCNDATFLSVTDSRTVDYELFKVLPYNHYSRKMLGYLYAMELGASCIVDTDDDNIPKENWDFPDFDGEFESTEPDKGFINVYKFFTDMHIWPRGLPLRLINHKEHYLLNEKSDSKIGVWQALADEDPDVDAIYRLTINEPCYFNDREPFFLSTNTIAPFNTQNTIIRRELFPLLYLPMYVTFRFTDILRGLVAQPIMWLYGYSLGFLGATVVQKRNEHDYYKDFLSELPMYDYCEQVIIIVKDSISNEKTLTANLLAAYIALNKHGIVLDKEITALEAWLTDINKFNF